MSGTSSSGNRWEPDATAPPHVPPQAETEPPVAPPAGGPGWRTRRGAGLLAGIASVFLLGGGAGGYAIGHATRTTPVQNQQGGQSGPGSTQDGPGSTRFGPGHRFRDGDGDRDRDGGGSGRRT